MIPFDLNSLLAFFQKQGHSAEIQAETNQIYFSMKVGVIPNGNYIARITTLDDGKQNNFKIIVVK